MEKINNDVFQRIEKKYLLSENNFNSLFQKIEPYMSIDKFGLHTICNIYYDTETFDLIRNSIEKPFYKEKLRLRSYGVPGDDSRVFLEIKKKYNHTVFKRRISLSFNEAWNYVELGLKPSADSQILREIDYFIKLYNPKKKVFIAYDRIALFGKEDENLRITFDIDIRSRTNDLDLRKGDYGKIIYNCGYLMEIKTSASLPMWLARALSELEIFPVSFSKYGEVYKQDLVNERFLKQSYKEELIHQDLINKTINSSTNWRNIKCLQAY